MWYVDRYGSRVYLTYKWFTDALVLIPYPLVQKQLINLIIFMRASIECVIALHDRPSNLLATLGDLLHFKCSLHSKNFLNTYSCKGIRILCVGNRKRSIFHNRYVHGGNWQGSRLWQWNGQFEFDRKMFVVQTPVDGRYRINKRPSQLVMIVVLCAVKWKI